LDLDFLITDIDLRMALELEGGVCPEVLTKSRIRAGQKVP
jgi:hypothetical protein